MKMKTLSSAKKRVKVTGTGKYLTGKIAKRHLLKDKSTKAKGRNKYGMMLGSANVLEAKRSLPYSL